ncbi:MAG: hypothetical protein JSV05_04830 [Candidatus Bathyarchaeota archaeon]|nr:MAG: hypothetical protein JSV05_04830 [Candidatus Bathyarchaeota archaeon]
MRSQSVLAIVFLTISFLGLAFVTAFINLPVEISGSFYWRRSIASTLFSIICILGIIAGVFPLKCSGIFHFRRVTKGTGVQRPAEETTKNLSSMRGHHPDCGNFDTHLFIIRNRAFCAGCTGLILGAFLSLLGIVIWIFIESSFFKRPLPLFIVGFIGVSCGLLQYQLLGFAKGIGHLAVNLFFVVSAFFLLVGVDGLTQNINADLFLVSLSIFWIFTRIKLSQQSHHRICTDCGWEECNFAEENKEV